MTSGSAANMTASKSSLKWSDFNPSSGDSGPFRFASLQEIAQKSRTGTRPCATKEERRLIVFWGRSRTLHASADRMHESLLSHLYLTELMGLVVYDLRGRRIGKIQDAALVPLVDSARVDRFLVGG